MEIRVAEERRPERCLYCHDSLGERYFTCDSCGATYHRECTTGCVNLGCRGAVHLDPAARQSEQRRFSRLSILVVLAAFAFPCLFAATAMGLWGDLLSRGALAPLVTTALILATPIALFRLRDRVRGKLGRSTSNGSGATAADAPRVRVKPTAVAVQRPAGLPSPAPPAVADPSPAPGELQMPSLFAAHPIAMEKTTGPDDVERAQHQREARQDRIRPPGLGKTI